MPNIKLLEERTVEKLTSFVVAAFVARAGQPVFRDSSKEVVGNQSPSKSLSLVGQYRGAVPGVLSAIFKSGVTIEVTGHGNGTSWESMAPTFGSILGNAISHPLSTISQVQTSKDRTVSQIIARRGVRLFYQGLLTRTARDTITMLPFGVLRKAIIDNLGVPQNVTEAQQAAVLYSYGVVSGTVAAWVSTPINTMYTMMTYHRCGWREAYNYMKQTKDFSEERHVARKVVSTATKPLDILKKGLSETIGGTTSDGYQMLRTLWRCAPKTAWPFGVFIAGPLMVFTYTDKASQKK